MPTVAVRVDQLTRIEGHGNIMVSLSEGRVEDAALQVVEALRFFEAILQERPYDEVSHIASRICGICAVSHSCASLQATEKALGIGVSPQTTLLRRLIMNAEVISSHALHVYFLAAPDFLELDSVMPLVQDNPEAVRRAYRLKQTAYDLGALIGGRHTHPISLIPGGFTSVPTISHLRQMRERLVGLREDVDHAIALYRTFDIPAFERPTEYVCLQQADHYGFYGGDLISSDGGRVDAQRYREAIREHVVCHSTAKHARWHRDNYLVGGLSRVNNKWEQLRPEAREAAVALGLTPPCTNPFMNTVAQVVELVHCVEDSIGLIDEIIRQGPTDETEPVIEPRAGRGVGVVEAPRGILIHDYTYDDRGRCVEANCVTPTAQNLGNLDADMRAYAAQLKHEPADEIRQQMEMLVRAYDPCISCSTH